MIGMQQATLLSSELFIYWTFNECERLDNAAAQVRVLLFITGDN